MKTKAPRLSESTGRLLIVAATLLAFSTCKSDETTRETPRAYNVSGTITRSDGGAAAGASVMLLQNTDNSTAGQAPANAAGEYIIAGVNAGSYHIVAALDGHESGTINGVNVIDKDLTLDNLELLKINAPTFTIGGLVAKPDGSIAAGATVQLRAATDNTIVGQGATTDATGTYSIGGIPAGAYNIIISLEGHETGVLSNVEVSNANLTAPKITLQTIAVNPNAITITYSDAGAIITNLPVDGSVTATTSGAHVTIASAATGTVEFHVAGSTSNGSLKIQNNAASPNTLRVTLSSAVIVSASKLPPVQVTKNEGATVFELKGNSILADNATNEENAALVSKSGSIEFEGHGYLSVTGAAKHAIASSKKNITVRGGNITVPSAASDGIHAETGLEQSGGSLDIAALGDGVDAGSGTILINGGNARVISTADDTKGIKADAGVIINNGTIEITVSGARSKGVSSKENIAVNGGNISISTSGPTVLEPVDSGYDPSYCTAIKSDLDINITGGTINIESAATADGGKGISADGNITVSGGTIRVTTAGNGKTYTAAAGTPDSYTAACLKSDNNITILGGNITCNSSGTGGKGISADGNLAIGSAGASNANLSLTVGTSGERFLVTSASGIRPPGGGGFGDNGTDYANPKAIKCVGDMTINSGTIFINCTQKDEGGEGLESKGALVINGGNIDIHTHDDCINGGTSTVINGGNIFCASTGNDAIDSNGPLTINGGLTIANGTRGDGEAFDAERDFRVNGGIIVGTHGGTMMTTPSGQQRSLRLQAPAGSAIAIKNPAGEYILLFNIPVIAGATTSSTLTITFSSPNLVSGTYALLGGGSITGGVTTNGYNTGGTYTGGSSKNFNM